MRSRVDLTDRPDRNRPSGAPVRELDNAPRTELAGTPCNLIRRPVQLPPMERVQKGGER